MSTIVDDSEPQTPKPQASADALAAPAKTTNGSRSRLRILMGVTVLLIIGAGAAGYWYFFMHGIVSSDDARLSGHLVDLAPEINDRLVDVSVHEGQFVHKGDVLFRLDPSTPEATLAQVQAALTSANASLAVSQAKYDRAVNGSRPEEIKGAQAILKRLQNEEDFALVEYERTKAMTERKVATQDEVDRLQTAWESARQNRENAAQILSMLQKGTRKEDLAAAKADVELSRSRIVEAQAAADKARSDLSRCVVTAPFDGWIVRRWLDAGAMPLPGQPVVSMFDPATLRIDANIEEKYLHDVAIGDEVDIDVDAFPGLNLKGRVTEILRATNSQFSLMPADGVSGTFIKVTQRIPLRISVQAPQDLAIGPGLSVMARIHIGSAPAHAQAVARD